MRFTFGEVLQQGNFYNGNFRSTCGGFVCRADGREETVCQRFTYYGFRYVKVSGWPGDAQVFAPTACRNMDCRAFYRGYLAFLRSEQMRNRGAVPTYVPSKNDFTACAIWSDAAALLPQTLRRVTGVDEECDAHYDLMKDWADYVLVQNPGPLYTNGFQFGNWLAQDGITPQSFKGGTDDVFLASVYRMVTADITAETARRIGREADALRFADLAEEIRKAVLEEYFTPSGRLSVDTQAAYVTALRFGLWRDRDVLPEQFCRRLKYDNFRICCGFAGAPLICSVLAEQGLGELACDLLLAEGFPGWMYAVSLGATTVWERWNSILEDGSISGTGMKSLNHYAYGSVMEYVYGYLAGWTAFAKLLPARIAAAGRSAKTASWR